MLPFIMFPFIMLPVMLPVVMLPMFIRPIIMLEFIMVGAIMLGVIIDRPAIIPIRPPAQAGGRNVNVTKPTVADRNRCLMCVAISFLSFQFLKTCDLMQPPGVAIK